MAVAWPANVPDKFEQGSYGSNPQSAIIRTEMSTGYPKVRRRFTAISKYHNGSIIMTTTEKEAFETWFNSIGGYGTEEFTFSNPQDIASTITCRFVIDAGSKPYDVKPDGETGDWVISFDLEELP